MRQAQYFLRVIAPASIRPIIAEPELQPPPLLERPPVLLLPVLFLVVLPPVLLFVLGVVLVSGLVRVLPPMLSLYV